MNLLQKNISDKNNESKPTVTFSELLGLLAFWGLGVLFFPLVYEAIILENFWAAICSTFVFVKN